MPRPKGSGVLKTIDRSKDDFFTIRRMMHAGGEPVKGEGANLLIQWRNLIAHRDDCARRIEAGEGNKWARRAYRQLSKDIAAAWLQLGAHLEKMGAADWKSERLSETLALLAKAVRPAVFPWQKEATRLVESYAASGLPPPTAKQLREDVCKEGYNVTEHDLRRFVRDSLRVSLSSEKGKRHDLLKKSSLRTPVPIHRLPPSLA